MWSVHVIFVVGASDIHGQCARDTCARMSEHGYNKKGWGNDDTSLVYVIHSIA